ncbi:MAG: sigma-70 family RNA polymerase sigma factor [Thermoanaerobaculia bacterium]|nr:sigma-70 family RNA polymerase sigma factor [Thermoanaerobaculia bacterium]
MARKTPLDDEELVARTLAGRADAFSYLVERYQRPVLSLIYRMVHDPVLAEDLAQEAFVRAYQRLDRYQPGRKFSSWLFKVAHNRTIDHLRRKKPVEVDLEAQADGGESKWEVLEADEDASSPERHFEMGETARTIGRALADLRDNYREVLVLRFEHELSYQEIADVTGASLSSVKVLLHRARKALARELGKRGVEPPEAFT